MSIKSSLPSLAADPHSMIRRMRRVREISVEELARRCQVPMADIRHWERTNTYPDQATLSTLATALHVKAAVLMRKGDGPLPGAPVGVPAWFLALTQRVLTLFPPR